MIRKQVDALLATMAAHVRSSSRGPIPTDLEEILALVDDRVSNAKGCRVSEAEEHDVRFAAHIMLDQLIDRWYTG